MTGKTGQITTVYADVWTEASVGPAVNGAEAATVVCLEQGEAGRWAITWMVIPELAPPLG